MKAHIVYFPVTPERYAKYETWQIKQLAAGRTDTKELPSPKSILVLADYPKPLAKSVA